MAAAPPEAVAAFPPPPAFYKLYAGGPNAGPPPPPPLEEDVVTFGDDLISLVCVRLALVGQGRVGLQRRRAAAAVAPRCSQHGPSSLNTTHTQNEPFVQPLEVQRMYRVGDDGSIGARGVCVDSWRLLLPPSHASHRGRGGGGAPRRAARALERECA